jgi:hypothetical protein
MELLMTTEFRRSDRYVYRLIAGEHLLIALHRNAEAPMFALTESGARLWESLAAWRSESDLADVLTAAYDVEAEPARVDAREFLGQLEALGAIEAREAVG